MAARRRHRRPRRRRRQHRTRARRRASRRHRQPTRRRRASAGRSALGDADPRGTLADVLWRHRLAQHALAPAAVRMPRVTEDRGEIAIVQDDGDLVAPANAFDIPLTGLRYAPRPGGGYDISRTDSSFRGALGDRVTLGDDDSVAKSLPFSFTFYGTHAIGRVRQLRRQHHVRRRRQREHRPQRRAGCCRALRASPRFWPTSIPRSAASVFVRPAPMRSPRRGAACGSSIRAARRTMQTSLFPDGSLEMKYAAAPPWNAADGIAGISPGIPARSCRSI